MMGHYMHKGKVPGPAQFNSIAENRPGVDQNNLILIYISLQVLLSDGILPLCVPPLWLIQLHFSPVSLKRNKCHVQRMIVVI